MFLERNFCTIFAITNKCTTNFQVYQSPTMKSRTFKICSITLAIALSALSFDVSAQNTSGLGLHTIVIDPGHGGKDPGAVSKDRQTYEKTLALKISQKIRQKIKEECPDVKVLLTRERNDVFVPLIDRSRFATKNNADFFLSVHINATESTSPNGCSVFLLGQSKKKNTDTYALNMDVVKRENEVILLEDDYSTTYQGFDPNDPESDIFLHLMHNAYREQSLMFAQMVETELKNGPFHKCSGIFQDNFQVLRLASMPAMLLELGYITNKGDLEVLRSEENLDKIAGAVAAAFKNYKLVYDESVGSTSSAKAAEKVVKEEEKPVAIEEPKPVSKPETVENNPSVYYGTQVLASKRKMDTGDKYFLGKECRIIPAGEIFKYIIGISEDKEEARKEFVSIKKKYPDSFMVEVTSEGCKRL